MMYLIVALNQEYYLPQPSKDLPPPPSTLQSQIHSPTYACMKLVDYSSSSEAENIVEQLTVTDMNIICDRMPQFHSPIPSTSRLGQNVLRRPVINSSTSGSDDENIDINILQKKLQYSPRNFKIYTSLESEENILDLCNEEAAHADQQTRRIEIEDYHFDDSDSIPLSNFKRNNKESQKKSSFHEFIPTPNFATIKSKPRRKAINYVGQRVTKDLFNAVEEKKEKKKLKTSKPKPKNTESRRNNQKNKNGDRKVERRKVKEKRVNVKNRGIRTKENKTESWYCPACKAERLEPMRQCIGCFLWYHEECVGLTKNDVEEFLCPECN